MNIHRKRNSFSRIWRALNCVMLWFVSPNLRILAIHTTCIHVWLLCKKNVTSHHTDLRTTDDNASCQLYVLHWKLCCFDSISWDSFSFYREKKVKAIIFHIEFLSFFFFSAINLICCQLQSLQIFNSLIINKYGEIKYYNTIVMSWMEMTWSENDSQNDIKPMNKIHQLTKAIR